MFSLNSSNRYYLYQGACDMRKSFDGLTGLVRNELDREPGSGDVFAFLNRSRTHIKLLHWENGGYVLYYKRLEKGTFAPPKTIGENGTLKWPELVLMIEGIQVQKKHSKTALSPIKKNRKYVKKGGFIYSAFFNIFREWI